MTGFQPAPVPKLPGKKRTAGPRPNSLNSILFGKRGINQDNSRLLRYFKFIESQKQSPAAIKTPKTNKLKVNIPSHVAE